MAQKKLPISKLGKTAKYYRTHPKARALKQKKDAEINRRPDQRAKRSELGVKRVRMLKKGINLKGKDLAHTKKGIRIKSIKSNRGAKGDMAGDRNARGG